MEEKFHDCYVKGFDPLYAAEVVGTDKKTAYRCYNKMTTEITFHHKDDFEKEGVFRDKEFMNRILTELTPSRNC